MPVASCFADFSVVGSWQSPQENIADGVVYQIRATNLASVSSSEFMSGSYSVVTHTVNDYGLDLTTTEYFNAFLPGQDVDGLEYANGQPVSSAGTTITKTGSAGVGSYLNLQSSASVGGFLTSVVFTFYFNNTTDEGLKIDSLTLFPQYNSQVNSVSAFSSDNLLLSYITPNTGAGMIVTPATGSFKVSAGSVGRYTFTLVFTSDQPLTSSVVSSVNSTVAGVSFGDYYSDNPATDGGIRDSIEDQFDTDSGQQEEITGDVNTAVTDIENIGLFSFLIDFSKQFVGVFSSGDDSTALTLPGFSITVDGQQLTVWEAQTFDFATMEGPFAVLLAAMRLGTSVVVIGALISYLFGLYEHIFAGSEQY